MIEQEQVTVSTTEKGNYRNGRQVTLPILGFFFIPSCGTFKVEKNLGEKFVETVEGFEIREPIAPQTTEGGEVLEKKKNDKGQILPQTTEEGLKLSEGEEVSLSELEVIESLSGLTVPELQVMAEPFTEKEWKNLKKQDLINYLATKLK